MSYFSHSTGYVMSVCEPNSSSVNIMLIDLKCCPRIWLSSSLRPSIFFLITGCHSSRTPSNYLRSFTSTYWVGGEGREITCLMLGLLLFWLWTPCAAEWNRPKRSGALCNIATYLPIILETGANPTQGWTMHTCTSTDLVLFRLPAHGLWLHNSSFRKGKVVSVLN
jgi:hypothetical protein